MICSIKSHDPEKYNTVSFNIDIPWKSRYVKYYVSSINTLSNIMLTTDTDYILFKYIERKNQPVIESIKIQFQNKFKYSIDELVKYLNENQMLLNKGVKALNFSINENKTITINNSDIDMAVMSCTPRIKNLLGLYNTNIDSIVISKSYSISDIPILQHTKFYLVSLQGQAVQSNIGDKEYTPSIIGNIDTITLDGKPFIYNFEKEGKPLKIKTYTDSLKYLELSLVDFMYQPVVLKSPLFITLKVKPAKDADIKDVLTK